MKTISIGELHARTGAWVRKAVELGAIIVTERGKPLGTDSTAIVSEDRARAEPP